ncbi:MAG: lipase chaperone [Candidatus Schekmanbacteria bacterium]|nr:lipase chaperone [Candidatus Schekmanbacteria bacterium]
MDGALPITDAGELIVTPGLRRFFDYHLTALGELSDEEIERRIRATLVAELPPAAAARAIEILDAYMHYRELAREVVDVRAETDELDARLAQLIALRRDVFGAAVAAALFGEEERQLAAAIERRRIMSDQTLPALRKEDLLAELDRDLPADERAMRRAETLPGRLLAQEQRMRAAGRSAADVEAFRQQLVGQEAAQRLAELDRQRTDWSRRVTTFFAAKEALEADRLLGAQQRRESIRRLLEASFSAAERLRVEAAARAAASGS